MSQADFLSALGTHIDGLPAEDKQPHWLSGHLVEYVLRGLDDFVHKLGGIDILETALRTAYRQYVAPFDLPYVPNTLEPIVDQLFEDALIKAVRFAHEKAHKD
jgi:hypothetical protein